MNTKKIFEALELVLDLAEDNRLDARDDPEFEDEAQKQQEALDIVYVVRSKLASEVALKDKAMSEKHVELLDCLARYSGETVSEANLACYLGIKGPTVRQYIQDLRRRGIAIESIRGKGWRI